MFDLAAEFGTERDPAYDEWYFGTPWEHPERFAHSWPYMYIRNARTPTLILQGENDPIDPLGQSTALYRARSSDTGLGPNWSRIRVNPTARARKSTKSISSPAYSGGSIAI